MIEGINQILSNIPEKPMSEHEAALRVIRSVCELAEGESEDKMAETVMTAMKSAKGVGMTYLSLGTNRTHFTGDFRADAFNLVRVLASHYAITNKMVVTIGYLDAMGTYYNIDFWPIIQQKYGRK